MNFDDDDDDDECDKHDSKDDNFVFKKSIKNILYNFDIKAVEHADKDEWSIRNLEYILSFYEMDHRTLSRSLHLFVTSPDTREKRQG